MRIGFTRRARHRLLAGAAVVVAGLGVTSVPATAAPVDVTGCTVNGTAVTVTVDDETLGPYEGNWYALHTRLGEAIDHEADLGTLDVAGPICVAPVSGGAIDSSQTTWAWCIEFDDAVCAEEPWTSRELADVLTPEQQALVTWRINEWMA
jgi:hypothetical protein